MHFQAHSAGKKFFFLRFFFAVCAFFPPKSQNKLQVNPPQPPRPWTSGKLNTPHGRGHVWGFSSTAYPMAIFRGLISGWVGPRWDPTPPPPRVTPHGAGQLFENTLVGTIQLERCTAARPRLNLGLQHFSRPGGGLAMPSPSANSGGLWLRLLNGSCNRS